MTEIKERKLIPVKQIDPDHPSFAYILALAYEGKTVKGVKTSIKTYGYSLDGIPDSALIKLFREYKANINLERTQREKELSLLAGLSDINIRIARLCSFADQIEPLSTLTPQWANVYRQVLSQIRAEVEPLNLNVNLSGDPWAELLKGVIGAGPREDMESGNLETETGNTE